MAKPESKLTLNETYLVPDVQQMHNDACIENHGSLKNWEWYLRHEVFPTKQYSLVTRALFTYPDRKKTSVLMHEAFPVLKTATVSSINPDFVPRRSDIEALGNVHMQLASTFESPQHGLIHLVGISVLAANESSRKGQLQIGFLTTEHQNDITLSMTNLGDPSELLLFFVTMIVPFTGCRSCGHMGEPTETTRAKMRKCGRCWRRLRFPVWYCCKDCQCIDYARHSKHDGCGELRPH